MWPAQFRQPLRGIFLKAARLALSILCVTGFICGCVSGSKSRKVTLVEQGAPFEKIFISKRAPSFGYEPEVKVFFHSPTGITNSAFALHDEGRRWRVRFTPEETGRWTYSTLSQDGDNSGLHGRSGSFICFARINPRENSITTNRPASK